MDVEALPDKRIGLSFFGSQWESFSNFFSFLEKITGHAAYFAATACSPAPISITHSCRRLLSGGSFVALFRRKKENST